MLYYLCSQKAQNMLTSFLNIPLCYSIFGWRFWFSQHFLFCKSSCILKEIANSLWHICGIKVVTFCDKWWFMGEKNESGTAAGSYSEIMDIYCLQKEGCLCTLHCISFHLFKLLCTALHCIILYCIALHCTLLYYIALYCTALHCIILYCIALHCTALHYIALYCTALYCIILYCIALHCTELHCIVLHCIALQYIALYCTVLHRRVNMFLKACILSRAQWDLRPK